MSISLGASRPRVDAHGPTPDEIPDAMGMEGSEEIAKVAL
jgi:hypothetical protein